MPTKDEISDDYVASLLAKDAKSSNAKYSQYGLQELLPKRATTNAPKPNTRFLKNIIRETDNHNAALRAKELAESRVRLWRLRQGEGNEASSSSTNGYSRLTPEDHHRSKWRRVESEDELDLDRRRYHGKSHSRRDRETDSRSHRRHRHHHHRRHRSDPYDSDDAEDERSCHYERRHHHHGSVRPRSRSRKRDEPSTKHQRRPKSRHRSRSRSPGPDRERRSHRRRSPPRRSTSSVSKDSGARESAESRAKEGNIPPVPFGKDSHNSKKRFPSPANDSDPLESIIGPPPPPPAPKIKGRGRGTFASTSAMDSHFSSNYDPSIDVQPDLDVDDDWDMALEALRDRQRWQEQGAERLKSAGFTEEEVQKWEKGGEKREEDVVWKERGEGREWDRGKVVGENGVETKPEWGRLKGT